MIREAACVRTETLDALWEAEKRGAWNRRNLHQDTTPTSVGGLWCTSIYA